MTNMRLRPVDRYLALMDAAARIAAVLIERSDEASTRVAQPIRTAVDLAVDLEYEVAAALELELEGPRPRG